MSAGARGEFKLKPGNKQTVKELQSLVKSLKL